MNYMRAMAGIANGQVDIVVPGAARSDEIGDMAKTVTVILAKHAYKVSKSKSGAVSVTLGAAGVAPDLLGAHHTPVALVANGLQLAGAVPAAQRVGADADGGGGLAQSQVGAHLWKHTRAP